MARPARRLAESDRAIDAYALVHAASVAGDALLAVGLADSVFFSVSPEQAKLRVGAYLLLTMAPLAVAAPLLARLLAHGGYRRAATVIAAIVRATAAGLLASRTETWLLFPLAFVALVASRVHLVTKNALTAAYAEEAGLVRENALLSRVGAISATLAALPGVLAAKFGGPGAALFMAAFAYAVCALLGTRLPWAGDGAGRERSRNRAPVRVPHAVETAGWAMSAVRAGQGFLVMLVAFALRRVGEPGYWLGILIGALAAGSFVGSFVAPRVARAGRESRVVLVALLIAAGATAAAAVEFSLGAMAGSAFVVGAAGETARLAFQSMVQASSGAGAEGRAYVRFEVRFQLAWVAGAIVPAMLPIGFREGLLVMAGIYAGVAVWRFGFSREAQES